MIPFVDLTDQVNAVRAEFDAYELGTAKLIEMHGGDFVDHKATSLAEFGDCKAVANIAQTPDGLWLSGYDYSYSTGAGNNGPSVWNRRAYTSRDDAVRAAAQHLAKTFGDVVTTGNSCVSDGSRRNAEKMVEKLNAIANPPIPDLFASPPQPIHPRHAGRIAKRHEVEGQGQLL